MEYQYRGQLFTGDPINKTWSPIGKGVVNVAIIHSPGKWSLVATTIEDNQQVMYCDPPISNTHTVQIWEMPIEKSFKHRIKDNFVQWQEQSGDTKVATYGLRIKEPQKAKEVRHSKHYIHCIKFFY